jgi:hypothetical protein
MGSSRLSRLGKTVCISAVFMAASLAGTAQGYSQPSTAPLLKNDNIHQDHLHCVQNLTREQSLALGFTNASSLQLASLYSHYLKEKGRDDSAKAVAAILEASQATDTDLSFLIVQAMLESALGTYNTPPVGSARGLFQYMPATWLTVFHRYGADFQNGKYKDLVDEITLSPTPDASSEEIKQKILDLRSDPYLSAYLKASQLKYEDGPVLRASLGRDINHTDLYIAHLLGLKQAKRFFYHYKYNPDHVAASRLSKEARYNPRLFYNSKGRALSFEQVYQTIERKVNKRYQWLNQSVTLASNSGQCITPIHNSQQIA